MQSYSNYTPTTSLVLVDAKPPPSSVASVSTRSYTIVTKQALLVRHSQKLQLQVRQLGCLSGWIGVACSTHTTCDTDHDHCHLANSVLTTTTLAQENWPTIDAMPSCSLIRIFRSASVIHRGINVEGRYAAQRLSHADGVKNKGETKVLKLLQGTGTCGQTRCNEQRTAALRHLSAKFSASETVEICFFQGPDRSDRAHFISTSHLISKIYTSAPLN